MSFSLSSKECSFLHLDLLLSWNENPQGYGSFWNRFLTSALEEGHEVGEGARSLPNEKWLTSVGGLNLQPLDCRWSTLRANLLLPELLPPPSPSTEEASFGFNHTKLTLNIHKWITYQPCHYDSRACCAVVQWWICKLHPDNEGSNPTLCFVSLLHHTHLYITLVFKAKTWSYPTPSFTFVMFREELNAQPSD